MQIFGSFEGSPFFFVHCLDWQYNDKMIPSDFVVGEVGPYNLSETCRCLLRDGGSLLEIWWNMHV